jgi:hypothetical protein
MDTCLYISCWWCNQEFGWLHSVEQAWDGYTRTAIPGQVRDVVRMTLTHTLDHSSQITMCLCY